MIKFICDIFFDGINRLFSVIDMLTLISSVLIYVFPNKLNQLIESTDISNVIAKSGPVTLIALGLSLLVQCFLTGYKYYKQNQNSLVTLEFSAKDMQCTGIKDQGSETIVSVKLLVELDILNPSKTDTWIYLNIDDIKCSWVRDLLTKPSDIEVFEISKISGRTQRKKTNKLRVSEGDQKKSIELNLQFRKPQSLTIPEFFAQLRDFQLSLEYTQHEKDKERRELHFDTNSIHTWFLKFHLIQGFKNRHVDHPQNYLEELLEDHREYLKSYWKVE